MFNYCSVVVTAYSGENIHQQMMDDLHDGLLLFIGQDELVFLKLKK